MGGPSNVLPNLFSNAVLPSARDSAVDHDTLQSILLTCLRKIVQAYVTAGEIFVNTTWFPMCLLFASDRSVSNSRTHPCTIKAFPCPHLDSFHTFTILSSAVIGSPNLVDGGTQSTCCFGFVLHPALVNFVFCILRNYDLLDNK